MDDSQRQALNAAVEALGLTYSATFVPQSQSRNKGEKYPSLNWRVKLSKGPYTLETDYSQGIAHVPNYDHSQSRLAWYADAMQQIAEKGKAPAFTIATPDAPTRFRKHTYEILTGFSSAIGAGWKALPAPALLDVLYCHVRDADVLQSASFEEWAQEYGYDTDSRQAEATYRACLTDALKFQAMIGVLALEKLRELFQDY